MIENQQDLHDYVGNESGDKFTFQRAFVNGKLGCLAIEAGRNHIALIGNGGVVYGRRADFVKASYGKDIKLTGMFGKLADAGQVQGDAEGHEFWLASVGGKIGVVNAEVTYLDVKDQHNGAGAAVADNTSKSKVDDNSILGIDVKFPIVKDLTLEGLWLKADNEDGAGNDQGVFAMLKYKGAKANKPGSWGVFAKYWNQAGTTVLSNGDDNNFQNDFRDAGFKGYGIGAEYAVAKNMIAYVDWVDLESKGDQTKDKEKDGAALWSHLVITF